MSSRMTKQGVRSLDPVGHNGNKRHGSSCQHWFSGPHIVVGHRWAVDSDYGDTYEEPVYGQRCQWCLATREIE